MRRLSVTAFILVFFFAANSLVADSLTLRNGDHLTGTITSMDGHEIALKTDAAGEIKIKWSAVQTLTSDKPLYIATPEKQTITGTITLEGSDLVVHTATQGDVRIPVDQITVVRTESQQHAYERSLHPSLVNDWAGGVNVGFALARGNSDTTNLNTALAADRKTLSDEIRLDLSSVYSTSGTSTSGAAGGVTANEILGSAAYHHDIDKAIFAFASGAFTHDALQDLTLRSIYTAGLGWHAINTRNTTLDALFGINYTRESYSSSPSSLNPIAINVSRNIPGITAGENFMHKFDAGTVFTESFDFYPDISDFSQYRFSLDAAVVTKIHKWLGWQTSLSDRYVTNPPIPGTKSNDVILSTGLSITFAH